MLSNLPRARPAAVWESPLHPWGLKGRCREVLKAEGLRHSGRDPNGDPQPWEVGQESWRHEAFFNYLAYFLSGKRMRVSISFEIAEGPFAKSHVFHAT